MHSTDNDTMNATPPAMRTDKSAPTVLIFDSGVGGLSILSAIRHRLPAAKLVFASDNAAYPYGTKSEAQLVPRVLNVVQHLLQETSADMVVIACNTASTVVLPSLRQTLTIPVIGVVPAIKPAVQMTQTQHIGVLATPATVERAYTHDLIAQFASQQQVSLLGSAELVDIAEQKLHANFVDKQALQRVIEPFLMQTKMDAIVLACTHFPLLMNELDDVFQQHQRSVQWVDSAQGIANRVHSLWQSISGDAMLSELVNSGGHIAMFTKAVELSSAFRSYTQELGIDDFRTLNMPYLDKV